MKRVMSIMITLLFGFTLIFSAIAAEDTINNTRHMPGDDHHHWPPWDPNSLESGHHSGNFKIADLLDDEDGPEILLLTGETLTFMNNKGEVVLTKEVEGIEDHHGEWWFMPGHGHGNGEVGLEIADLDDDGTSEIIILDTVKLIILDNTGEPKGSPITLP